MEQVSELSPSTKRVVCCHCAMSCGLLAHVEGGKVVRLEGDPNHLFSRGFICIKGERATEYSDHPDRLRFVKKRAGKRGEGKWVEISWDQAIDEIAAKLAETRNRYGAEAVAFSGGTIHGPECGIGIRFLNLFGSPNSSNVGIPCAGPALEAEALTYGFGPTIVSPPIPGTTRSVVIWGSRPSASQPPIWPLVLACRQSGAKVIVVDPIRTEEAKNADVWLQLRPSTDAALALGWLRVIVDEGLYDGEFVERWTHGFAELKERLKEYPLKRVEEITWVPEDKIREAARTYATNQPGVMLWGVANAQIGRNTIQAERTKAILRAITGALDVFGGTCLVGPPQKVLIPGDTELPDALPPEQREKKLGADRFRLHGDGYRLLNEAMSRVWYGKKHVTAQQWTADVPDPLLWETILTGEPYPVKALIIQYHNPLGGSPDSGKVYEALKGSKLDLVVVHELFMTPTAEMADYVLPASHWLERTGLHITAGWANIAVAGDKAVEPSFEQHSDYDLWRDLGRRLGQEAYWPSSLEGFWDEMLRPEGVTFSELVARPDPWVLGEWRFQKHQETDPETGEPRGFGTPTHKVELSSTILEKLGYDPLPFYEEPSESPITRPELASEYPLLLITGGTVIECHHQGFRQTRLFREKYPDPQVHVHPDTAKGLGIREGDWVWIETIRGKIRQKAKLTEDIHPRVVQADRWWYPEEEGAEPSLHGFWKSNVNLLTDGDTEHLDPAYGAWATRGNLCRVRKVERGET